MATDVMRQGRIRIFTHVKTLEPFHTIPEPHRLLTVEDIVTHFSFSQGHVSSSEGYGMLHLVSLKCT
jgi:hypothetical protein